MELLSGLSILRLHGFNLPLAFVILTCLLAGLIAPLPPVAAQDVPGCAYKPDSVDYCDSSSVLCNIADSIGESFRSACQTTCQVCKSQRQLDDEELQSGGTVVVRTGFILAEGSENEVSRDRGFELWLSHTKAETEGFPVGNGTVKIKHTTVYATPVPQNVTCEDSDYAEAARKLINDHQIEFAIIQTHTCKTMLSRMFHEADVVHYLQSGTDMVDEEGELYLNSHAWYLHMSSNEYPRLFLKQMEFDQNLNIGIMWYYGHEWATYSAKYLRDSLQTAYDNGQSKLQVVYAEGIAKEDGGKNLTSTDYNTTVWDGMLQEMTGAGAEVLVVYSIEEGLSIMKRVTALQMPFKGVYITVAPTKDAWTNELGLDGSYVVTPGQWSDQAVAPCSVFGSVSEYVEMYKAKYGGYTPDYNAAMSSFGGILMQLAMQKAGSITSQNILDSMLTMSYDTIMGRARFSVEHRNIGRDPVLMQVQDSNLQLILPAELAVAPFLKFVEWECRILVDDPTPERCSDEELAVFEGCFDTYRDRIDGTACLLRLEAERVAEWEGADVLDICGEYHDAEDAMTALELYNDLGSATLLFRQCNAQWTDGAEGITLPRLRRVGGDLVVQDLAGAANISLPALTHIEGSVRLSGRFNGVSVTLPNLVSIGHDYSVTDTTGSITMFLPKVRNIGGDIRVENNALGLQRVQLPLLETAGGLLLRNTTGKPLAVTLPNLQSVSGPFEVANTAGLGNLVLPLLSQVNGRVSILSNTDLVELSFALLTDIRGDTIDVTDNADLAFFNLAQAQTAVNYCDAFSRSDLTGNLALLNVRTLWFEPDSCTQLQDDNTANICPKGYVLVHGEGEESRCDEDWRSYFTNVLILAGCCICISAALILYQERQFKTFYCRPEFTNGNPIPRNLCGFDWHGSITNLLLSTVDMVSDIIFIQIQIEDLACRDYRGIITASLWVLIVSSGISCLRVCIEVFNLMRSKDRCIHFFPHPARGRPFSILEWLWCLCNCFVNIALVALCVTGLEPLRALPWDRPTTRVEMEILEGRDYMPDWHRFAHLNDNAEDQVENGSDSGDDRTSSSIGRKLWLYVSTLSFFDQFIGITEDVGQFVLQVMFLLSCHPTESAALTTLLSLMFSLLRAGLKFTQAVSDDVVKSMAVDFSKSMMNISARRWSSTGPSMSSMNTLKIAAAKVSPVGDEDEPSAGGIQTRPVWDS